MLPVFLDTCVLLKPYLCDSLLTIAEAGIYCPLWSPAVLEELSRNLIRRGLDDKQASHRIDQMTGAFPDAQVTGYQALITKMTNHPKDRHVLAAAVRGGAEVLVTENLRDFPVRSLDRGLAVRTMPNRRSPLDGGEQGGMPPVGLPSVGIFQAQQDHDG